MKPAVKMILLLILLFPLVSCHGNFRTIEPVIIPKKQVIPVDGSIREGIWRTSDLRIRYHFQPSSSDIILFSGEIDFEHWMEVNFSMVDRFQLNVFFLNDERKILGSQMAYMIANGPVSGELKRFDCRLTLPSGTTFVSFGYDAKVSSPSDEGRDSYDFWYP